MKKIAVVLPSMQGGGCERAVSLLLPVLVKHFQVSLILHEARINYEIPSELEIIDLKGDISAEHSIIFKIKRFFRRIFTLKKVLKENSFDLLFSFIDLNNVTSYIAWRLAGSQCKFCCTEQTLCKEFFENNQMANNKQYLMKLLISYVYKRANRVVLLSHSMESYLSSEFNIKRDFDVIYNGIDKEVFNRVGEAEPGITLEENFMKAPMRFINIGRLDVCQKNQEFLIRLFPKIKEAYPQAQLFFLGEGENRPVLEDLISELNLDENVHLLGWKNDLAAYMRHADLLLHCAYYETFGNVLIETIATGTPVVTTNCNAVIPEILQKGEYGYIVESYDELEYLNAINAAMKKKDDEDYSQKISDYARGKFAIEHIQAEYLKLCNEVIYRE